MRTFQCRKSWFMKQMWKTLVQCHIDYCSQLYLPSRPGDLQRIEDLQRMYTRKIPEVKGMNYWQRLKHLKMLSQERRSERYRAIYVWKILEGLVPNCGRTSTVNERRGRQVSIPVLKGSSKVRNLRETSFHVSGGSIYNQKFDLNQCR